MREGQGKEVLPDGTVYEGQFFADQKRGKGVLTWPDNESYYDGEWRNDKFQGKGKLKWEDGRTYIGSFHDDNLDGKGTMFCPDGRKYHGDWSMDKMHGFGTYSWPDGRVYEGNWRNNNTHGKGKFINSEGEIKLGLWDNGKRVKWFDNTELEKLRLQRNKQQDSNKAKQAALRSENEQLQEYNDGLATSLQEQLEKEKELVKQVSEHEENSVWLQGLQAQLKTEKEALEVAKAELDVNYQDAQKEIEDLQEKLAQSVPKPVEKAINKPLAPALAVASAGSNPAAGGADALLELAKRASLHSSVDEALIVQQQAIEAKGHAYNLVFDDTQPTNLMYKSFPEKRQKLMANANKVVKSNIGIYSKFTTGEDSQPLALQTLVPDDVFLHGKAGKFELYTEKIHIYEKNILKEILLVIYQNEMSFIYLEKDIFFMKPINICTDIEEVLDCSMFKSYYNIKNIKKEDQKEAPAYKYLAIKLVPAMAKAKRRQHSHIIFVQHQNSTEGSNFEKLKDFIAHQRMSFFCKEASYPPLKTKQEALDDFFEISEYNRITDFRFE